VLFSGSSFDGSKNHLYVLSPDLTVQSRFTMNDIVSVAPAGTPLKGTAAVSHRSDGTVVIGNLIAKPSGAGLSLTGKLPGGTALNNGAASGPDSASVTWTDFRSDDGSQTMSVSQLSYDLSSSFTMTKAMGGSYKLVKVLTNPEDGSANTAFLVFRDYSDTCFFLAAPEDPDFLNGFPGPPLFDNTAYTRFSMPNIDDRYIFGVSDGFVAYSYSTRALEHFTAATSATPALLHLGPISDYLGMSFSFSGRFFCVWDPDSRTISRYEAWW
jgi:hypothetical protein